MKALAAALLAAALLAPAVPAAACGSERPSRPDGMIADEARLRPLVEKLKAAQEGRERASERLWDVLKRREDYQALDKARGTARWGSPERNELGKRIDELTQREVWDKLKTVAPVRVYHAAYLCGSVTLDDGHSINKGSSWSIANELRPELGTLNAGGAEMHYLMEHFSATPSLIERLEKILEETPAASAPVPAKAAELELGRVSAALAPLSLPRWD